MKTPNDFEKWQQELLEAGEIAMTEEEINIAMDMMANETYYDLDNSHNPVEYSMDGFGVTKSGDVVYTNKADVLYQKAVAKQRRNRSAKERRKGFTLLQGGLSEDSNQE